MRLRKQRRASAASPSSPTAAPATASAPRVRNASAGTQPSSSSDSDSSTDKHAEAGASADAAFTYPPTDPSPDAEKTLEERRRRTEDAKKLAKAQLFLNSEVKRASTDALSFRAAASVTPAPTNLGSVTSETGSYLARLSAQAEAAEAKRGRGHRHAEDDDDDDDDSMHDNRRHRHGRPSAHGIVRRMAEKHHRKVEKREKRRRTERLRRIAALDPLKEGERQHGQAKETKFMALIRKYGDMAKENERQTKPGSTVDLTAQESRTADTTPSTETSSLDEHSAYLVDTLEVVDPGVSTAGHLSNIGNSLIFPNIPGLYDRRPVIDLPAQEVDASAASTEAQLQLEEGRLASPRLKAKAAAAASQEDEDDLHLDAYVHELLTKRQKFKRAMQGVWAFLKTPVGVIAGIYGFLVVFGGAALVLFLVGAIDGGKNKDFWVEVFSQFENGLFTIPGVGLIPWRLRDTWRAGWIAYYQHLTWRLRKKQGLPRLADKNDIPSVVAPKGHRKSRKDHVKTLTAEGGEKESAAQAAGTLGAQDGSSVGELERQGSTVSAVRREDEGEGHDDDDYDLTDDEDDDHALALSPDVVLSPSQAAKLHELQVAFGESQSWYRAHETFTHHAFSISYAVWITVMNDLNSLFQCLLCAYMWGYATHYRDRPAWSTGTFMPCSFLAGIGAAVLIWKGGEKSKKKREVEEKLLAAFARDIDAQVEQIRRENEARFNEPALETVREVDQPAAEAASSSPRADQEKTGLDLDTLATEIAAKDK